MTAADRIWRSALRSYLNREPTGISRPKGWSRKARRTRRVLDIAARRRKQLARTLRG